MTDREEKQRIADLEAEVASLRAKLGEQGDSEAAGSDIEESHPMGTPGQDHTPRPPMLKVVLLSAIVVCVGLAMIFGVFTVLSKGFDKFAPKAAERFIPKRGEKPLAPPTTKVVPGGAASQKAPATRPADAGEPKERVLVPGL